MQANVGCDYLSALPSYKRKVWHEMKRLNLADYEERQLEDFQSNKENQVFQLFIGTQIVQEKENKNETRWKQEKKQNSEKPLQNTIKRILDM